jgi:hypothetical protein
LALGPDAAICRGPSQRGVHRKALIEWSYAVWAARSGDLDKALEHVVQVRIEVDVPLRVGRSELRSITTGGGNRLDAELPDDED